MVLIFKRSIFDYRFNEHRHIFSAKQDYVVLWAFFAVILVFLKYIKHVYSIFLLRWCRAPNFEGSQIPLTR